MVELFCCGVKCLQVKLAHIRESATDARDTRWQVHQRCSTPDRGTIELPGCAVPHRDIANPGRGLGWHVVPDPHGRRIESSWQVDVDRGRGASEIDRSRRKTVVVRLDRQLVAALDAADLADLERSVLVLGWEQELAAGQVSTCEHPASGQVDDVENPKRPRIAGPIELDGRRQEAAGHDRILVPAVAIGQVDRNAVIVPLVIPEVVGVGAHGCLLARRMKCKNGSAPAGVDAGSASTEVTEATQPPSETGRA